MLFSSFCIPLKDNKVDMGPSKHLQRILALRHKYEKTKLITMPCSPRVCRHRSTAGEFLRGRPSLTKTTKLKELKVTSSTLEETLDLNKEEFNEPEEIVTMIPTESEMSRERPCVSPDLFDDDIKMDSSYSAACGPEGLEEESVDTSSTGKSFTFTTQNTHKKPHKKFRTYGMTNIRRYEKE